MPLYSQSSATNPITCLNPGSRQNVLQAEAFALGAASQAVALSNYPQGGATPLSVHIVFSKAPGAFTYNLQFSNDDYNGGAASYAMPDNTFQITAANLDPNNNAVHFEAPFSNALCARIFCAAASSTGALATVTFKR